MNLQHNLNVDVYHLFRMNVATPSAGDPAEITIPANSHAQILSISFQIAADGTAANRLPYVAISSGGKLVHVALAKGLVTANETIKCHFAIGIAGEDTTATHNLQYAALPDQMHAVIGDKVYCYAFGIQAADQISAAIYRAKQWIAEN